jgi:hypothetical protein
MIPNITYTRLPLDGALLGAESHEQGIASFLSFFLAPLIVLILSNYDISILACLDFFTLLPSKVQSH